MNSHIAFLKPEGPSEHTEVMRITRDGVFVNPDVAVDDVAKVVLDALDDQIKVLVQKALEEEREACAKVCEAEGERVDASWVSCAFAIRRRGAV